MNKILIIYGITMHFSTARGAPCDLYNNYYAASKQALPIRCVVVAVEFSEQKKNSMPFPKLRRYFVKKDSASLEPTEKVYNTFLDLLWVLLRSLIGVAVFSLHGEIVKSVTGPAILLSYVMTALVMLIAGVNLAEFASHSERSGSIYQQTYMEMGEFWAVVVGWLMFGAYCLGE
jgi:Amino acid permease